MVNITFVRQSDGYVFIVKENSQPESYFFSIQNAMSLPESSLIVLRMQFGYLKALIEREIEDSSLRLKKLKIEVMEEMMRRDSKISKTAASELVYSDTTYYSLSEKINELEFYSGIVDTIIKTIDLLIENSRRIGLNPHLQYFPNEEA